MKFKVVEFALRKTGLSPRKLVMTVMVNSHYFVSEAAVYRSLKTRDLMTSPVLIVLTAANEFITRQRSSNSFPLPSPQAASAVRRANRLHLNQGCGLGRVLSQHYTRHCALTNGKRLKRRIATLAEWLRDKGMKHARSALYHPQTQGKIALVSASCFARPCRAMEGTKRKTLEARRVPRRNTSQNQTNQISRTFS